MKGEKKMKKKIIGIMIVTLLIATATLPMVGNANDNKNSLSEDWAEKDKIIASDGASTDYFGFSVSIDGDYALIGASHDDDNGLGSGSAYVFKRSGTTWTEEDKLTASDGAILDWFGCRMIACLGSIYQRDGANSPLEYLGRCRVPE